MFNRTTTTTTEEPGVSPDLPAGHNDPDSRFYVHPSLRDLYRIDPLEDGKRLADDAYVGSWAATYRGAREYDRRCAAGARGIDQPDLPDDAKARIAANSHPRFASPGLTADSLTPEERDLFLHGQRILAAATIRRDLDQHERIDAQLRTRYTCQLCGTYALYAVHPFRIGAHLPLLCPTCAPIVEVVHHERVAAQVIDNGRSRREAAAAFLDQLTVGAT